MNITWSTIGSALNHGLVLSSISKDHIMLSAGPNHPAKDWPTDWYTVKIGDQYVLLPSWFDQFIQY